MQQYFVETINDDDTFTIIGQDAHHIMKVMRMRVGTEIMVVSEAVAYHCEITSLQEKEQIVIATKKATLQDKRELPIDVTVVLGLLKSDKFDYAVQKLTELGVTRIIPWQAEYSIVKLNGKKDEKKVARWQSIAKEAAEQSKRLVIPDISAPQHLTAILASVTNDTPIYVAFEGLAGKEQAKLDIIKHRKVVFVIGAEGGISPKELKLLENKQQVRFISLGSRILRAETAAIFAMSLCAGSAEQLI